MPHEKYYQNEPIHLARDDAIKEHLARGRRGTERQEKHLAFHAIHGIIATMSGNNRNAAGNFRNHPLGGCRQLPGEHKTGLFLEKTPDPRT